MEPVATGHPDYEAAQRSWEQETPWCRRVLAHMGIQGKLVICFTSLLLIGLGSSCWILVMSTNARLRDMMGEEAVQTAYALSLASRPALSSGRSAELRHIGQDLLKARNILFVAFLNQEGQPLLLASRDPDANWVHLLDQQRQTQSLMRVHAAASPVLGEYLEVTAPILGAAPREAAGPADPGAMQLLGYVTVGVSQSREQAQWQRIAYFVLGVGGLIGVLSLPLAYVAVYRIFQPIRELVTATNRIASGDLDAQVAIHRPDQIGTLARSFNEMVRRVKRQQEDLAAANHDLERKVQQRTAELEAANRRLSREIAEKEDFLRAVSHDLNAPLRNINGMATMLLMKHRQQFDEDVIHRLERIQKNVEMETDLIGELLELSRIKTRRQKMEPVETAALVQQLAGMFENDLRSRQISLIVDTPLPVLHCEAGRLRQVFQNLIDNAVKYMGEGCAQEGGPGLREIHFGCMLRPREAEFYVRDTGMGIDPEDLEKVFFIFRRGKNGTAQNVAGKGVGLASVKSIIETYNGTIWVESQVGHGSTFRFTISGEFVPSLARAEADGPRAPAAGEADKSGQQRPSQHGPILPQGAKE